MEGTDLISEKIAYCMTNQGRGFAADINYFSQKRIISREVIKTWSHSGGRKIAIRPKKINSFASRTRCWRSPWWRHQMETFSASLAFCEGNSPVIREFPSQRPVTRSFDDFFDMRLNKLLSKQSRHRWDETPLIMTSLLWTHLFLEYDVDDLVFIKVATFLKTMIWWDSVK